MIKFVGWSLKIILQTTKTRKATNVGYQVKVGKSTNDRKSVWMQNTTTLEGKHLSCKTKTGGKSVKVSSNTWIH